MLMLSYIICLLHTINVVQGSELVYYKFGLNFGQVFHDYSNNSQSAVNGASSAVDGSDTVPTDRGAYFSGGNPIITLPANDVASTALTFPSNFTIAMFLLANDEDGLIFFRCKDGSNYIYMIRRKGSDRLEFAIASNSGTSVINTGNDYTQGETPNKWVMISLSVDGLTASFCTEQGSSASSGSKQCNTKTLSVAYSETGVYNTVLGSNLLTKDKNTFSITTSSSNGYGPYSGYIWNFVLLDQGNAEEAYFLYYSSSNKCLVDSCSYSSGKCYPVLVDPDTSTQGCVSKEMDQTKDGTGSDCPSGCANTYGCSSAGCFDCGCPTGSCIMGSSGPTCICEVGYVAESNTCTCAGVLISGTCYACDSECSTCDTVSHCLTCVSVNASPGLVSGCVCNASYYQVLPLTNANACQQCFDECATCTQASICLTCASLNASPAVAGGCLCKTGYYNTTTLTSSNSCIQCNNNCYNCSQVDLCLTCIANNSSPSNTKGCECNQGYYNTSALTTNNTCLSCYQDCYNCTIAFKCSSCKSLNASPASSNIGCSCNTGYYNTSSLISSDSCVKCYSECYNCTQQLICSTCITLNASPNNAVGCQCNTGYYNTSALTSTTSCLACYSDCFNCSVANQCLTCKSKNASPASSNKGCSCNTGYYNTSSLTSTNSCLQCYSDCYNCTQQNICTTCVSLYASPNNVIGCQCNTGYYNTSALITSNSCINCYDECYNCSAAYKCLYCKSSNASPASTNIGCVCNTGYYNVSSLTNTLSCLQCYPECYNCTEGLICSTCITQNASPNSTIGCQCNIGYFNTTSLVLLNSCTPCYSQCKSCNQSSICLTCNDINASPNSYLGCDCNKGYYYDQNQTCQKCNVECKSCSNITACKECIGKNASVDPNGFCYCSAGYFNTSYMPTNCSLCLDTCLTCNTNQICETCKVQFANPKLALGCDCPNNSSQLNQTCVCNTGFYMTTYPNYTNAQYFDCLSCHISCETCSNGTIYACSQCAGLLSFDLNHTCSVCPSGTYFNDYVCQNCSSECKTCKSFHFCLSCSDKNYFLNNLTGVCEPVCNTGTFLSDNSCKACIVLCASCSDVNTCHTCVNHTLYSNNQCTCQLGYIKSNNTCVKSYFSSSLLINSNNKIQVSFSEVPSISLNASDFQIFINNSQYSMNLFQRDSSTYYITLTFTSVVASNTLIDVLINVPVLYSTSNSELSNYNLYGYLNYYNPVVISSQLQALTQTTGAAVKVTITSAIGSAIVGNPAAAWVIINTIQFITYLPMNDNPLTPGLQAFCNSLAGFNLLPNPMTYIFNPNSTSVPYTEASNFGYKTSVFWINIGQDVSAILFLIALWPFVFLLSKCKLGKITMKLSSFLSNYRYSVFLRFWIQAYLDVGFAALIQLKSVSFN